MAVSTSICIFFYSTASSLAFWIYSCHYQRVTDTFYSVRHAGAKGCFTRLRFTEIVVAIGVVILELSIAASKYFVQIDNKNVSVQQEVLLWTNLAVKVMYSTNLLIALVRMQRQLAKYADLTLNKVVVTLLVVSYTAYVFAYWAYYLKVSIGNWMSSAGLIFELLFASS